MQLTQTLLDDVMHIAHQAGEHILSVYCKVAGNVTNKHDGSPLTSADLLAHDAIARGLKRITPHVPVLSEESKEIEIQQRYQWPILWLVDPLDGTKEFLHRTDEFTVNIALIVQHQPVLGVVYAPALGVMYFAMEGLGAYKKEREKVTRIFARRWNDEEAYCPASFPDSLSLPLAIRVIASRRHGSEALKAFLQQLPHYTLVNAGSALKICKVAEGAADVYPRLGPTYEWDTAAGHAIIHQAGGVLCDAQYRAFQYNARKTLLNESFIVCHQQAPRFVFARKYD